jgi:hypothetical protein
MEQNSSLSSYPLHRKSSAQATTKTACKQTENLPTSEKIVGGALLIKIANSLRCSIGGNCTADRGRNGPASLLLMSERRFKNSWNRLDRATFHLSAFQAEWNRLLAHNPFGSIVRHDENTGWWVASLTADDVTREAIENTTLPLILGEYAYQLRAALDGLIWDAITFTRGTEPPVDANRLEFPVLNGKIRNFKDCGFHKFPFPEKLKTWLGSIQPGCAEKPLDHPDRGLANALEDVHNLARFDRHRRLRILAAFATELHANIVFDPPEGFKAVGREGLPCNILGGEYDLLRFKVESSTGIPPRKIRIETGAKFEIFFEDIPPLDELPSGAQLRMMCDAIGYVIGRFEEVFAS